MPDPSSGPLEYRAWRHYAFGRPLTYTNRRYGYEATYRDGIVQVIIQRRESAKPRLIEIH